MAETPAEELEERMVEWNAEMSGLEMLMGRSPGNTLGEEETALATIEESRQRLVNGLAGMKRAMKRERFLADTTRLHELTPRIAMVRKRVEIMARNPASFNTTSLTSNTTQMNTSFTRKSAQRLPKMNLVKYDGSPLMFQSFMDMFTASVDSNMDLTDVEKMNYLRSSCTGEVEGLMRSFPLTQDAYPLALAALKSTYGSEMARKTAIYKTIRQMKPVQQMSPIGLVKSTYLTISAAVRMLDQLGVPVQTAGILLVLEIMDKFPLQLSYRFYQLYEHGEDDAIKVLDFLGKEIRVAENAETGLNPVRTSQGNFPKQEKEYKSKPSGSMAVCNTSHGEASLEKDASTEKQSGKLECVFCRGDHLHSRCEKTMTTAERHDLVRKQKLCFNCLRSSHGVRDCTIKFSCRFCGRRHHSMLCYKGNAARGQTTEKNVINNVVLTVSSHIQLMVFTAKLIRTRREPYLVRGLIDPGAHRSYVSEKLVKLLDLKKRTNIKTMTQCLTDPVAVATDYEVYTVQLRSRHSGKGLTIDALKARTLPDIQTVVTKDIIERVQRLGLELAEEYPARSGQVDLLLGGETWWHIFLEGRRQIAPGLGVMNTIFGWIINGTTGNTDLLERGEELTCMNVACLSIEQQIERLWTLEGIGITAGEKESDFIRDRFQKSTRRREDGRYEVQLPTNSKIDNLESNWGPALSQLASTLRRIDSNDDLRLRYHDAIEEYLRNNHSELVDLKQESKQKLYYIPHQPVIREDRSTTKFRVVFNASSSKKGLSSLNDCLYPGPSLNPDILEMLIRFRLFRIIVISDIQKAFLQIEIRESQRDLLRFLWVKDTYFEKPYSWANVWNNLLVYRMRVVPFGVNSSPFLLCAAVRAEAAKYIDQYPEEAETLDRSIYVDDLLSGTDEVEQAVTSAGVLKDILAGAQMPLVKWASSNKAVHDNLKQKGFVMKELEYSAVRDVKLLGVLWTVPDDMIRMAVSPMDKGVVTKREVLARLASIFDPLGLVAPMVLEAKLLIQRLWQTTTGWDEPISETEQVNFRLWSNKLTKLNNVAVPRWMNTMATQDLRIEIYCDASPQAYGCAAYVRNGPEQSNLLMAKSRVAPMKELSLPRLELTAAVIGARLGQYIKQHLPSQFKVTNILYFSDSMITLAWIQADKNQWKAYVSNRVEEIVRLSRPEQWNYIETARNPADILTRPPKVEEFLCNGMWWTGVKEQAGPMVEQVDLPKEEYKHDNVILTTVVELEHMDTWVRRCSSFPRLARIMTYVGRWRTRKNRGLPITTQELIDAEDVLIRFSQQRYFGQELLDLESGKKLDSASILKSFNVFMDGKRILRMRSRLMQAPLDFLETHPIMLHPACWVVMLLVRRVHSDLMHGDVSETLHRVRDRFWILRARKLIKSVVHHCATCRIAKLPRNDPMTGDLPAERVTPSAPFVNTGLDYLGPVYIKEIKQRMRKSYVLLFTCLVTRAIHLEVTLDLSVVKFLMAFRRFAARFGYPALVFSDNAGAFTRGNVEIKTWGNLFRHDGIKTVFSEKRVEWRFIPPRAPWWGGAWERLVRVVKDKLRRTLGKRLVDLETLQTAVLEITSVINSRPLSYVVESAGAEFVLSPERFLTGGMPKYLLRKPFEAVSRRDLRKLEQTRREIIYEFWQLWRDSYLKQLRNFHERHGNTGYDNVKKGQVVLLERQGTNPFFWPMARVIEVMPGQDGVVRLVKIIDGTGKELLRSVKHVRVLEAE